MKKTNLCVLLSMFSILICTMGFAQSNKWSKQSTGNFNVARSYGIAMDNSGNTFSVGSFDGNSHFGTGGGLPFSGVEDIFVVKYSNAGTFQWEFSEGGIDQDQATAVVVDPTNTYVYVTGRFNGTATFKGTSVSGTTLTSAGQDDIFVAKYNVSNGNLVWVSQAGGSDEDESWAMVASSTGDVYITGGTKTLGTVVFGSLSFTPTTTEMYIAKINSSGTWQAVLPGGAGTNTGAEGRGIVLDASGNSYVTGIVAPASSPVWGATTLSPVTGTFVVKANSTLTSWTFAKGSTGTGNALAFGITRQGTSLYITGTLYGSTTFGTTTLAPTGPTDIFVASITTSGVWSWAVKAGSSGDDYGQAITSNSNGIYITGLDGYNTAAGNSTFGSITTSHTGTSDVYIAEIDKNGTFLCAKNAGGSSYDEGTAICTSTKNLIGISGYFRSPDFGWGMGLNAGPSASQAFAAYFDVVSVSPTTSTVCQGVPVVLTALNGGTAYTWAPPTGLSSTIGTSVTATPASTTTYTVTSALYYGCPSSASVTITIKPVPLANAGPDIFINRGGACGGTGVGMITATGGGTYSWSPTTYLITPASASTYVNPPNVNNTYNYTVTVTGANGCTATDGVVVTVGCIPRIGDDLSANDLIYSNPGNGDFTWNADFNPSEYYVYNVSGQMLRSGHLNPTQNSLNINDLSNGFYFLKFQSKEGIISFKYLLSK